jgi:hypothetical protein
MIASGPARVPSRIYVVGATLEEVRECLRHAQDAHDPLNFFSFSRTKSKYDGGPYRNDDKVVTATKFGADASYYADKLQARLLECGCDVTVTAIRPRAERGSAATLDITEHLG